MKLRFDLRHLYIRMLSNKWVDRKIERDNDTIRIKATYHWNNRYGFVTTITTYKIGIYGHGMEIIDAKEVT